MTEVLSENESGKWGEVERKITKRHGDPFCGMHMFVILFVGMLQKYINMSNVMKLFTSNWCH